MALGRKLFWGKLQGLQRCYICGPPNTSYPMDVLRELGFLIADSLDSPQIEIFPATDDLFNNRKERKQLRGL